MPHHEKPTTLKDTFVGRPREPHTGRRGVSPRFKDRVEAHDWRGKSAVDVGCGTGAGTVLLAKLGADALGIDIDAAVLIDANERAKEENATTARFACADAELVDLAGLAGAPAGLDGVLAHLCFSETLAKKAGEALRPGGVIIVRSFHKDMWKEAGGGSPFAFSEAGMRKLLSSAGFTVSHLEVERRVQTFDSMEAFEKDMLWDAGRRAHWDEDGRLETLRRKFAKGENRLTEAFIVVDARKKAAAGARKAPKKRLRKS